MALTTLDAKTALVVIDLQKGIVSSPTVHPVDAVVKRASAMADAFRRHGLPIVLVNVAAGAPGRTERAPRLAERPAGWTDFVPYVTQKREDHVVTNRTWGAFLYTDLEEHLRKLGVTQQEIIDLIEKRSA